MLTNKNITGKDRIILYSGLKKWKNIRNNIRTTDPFYCFCAMVGFYFFEFTVDMKTGKIISFGDGYKIINRC